MQFIQFSGDVFTAGGGKKYSRMSSSLLRIRKDFHNRGYISVKKGVVQFYSKSPIENESLLWDVYTDKKWVSGPSTTHCLVYGNPTLFKGHDNSILLGNKMDFIFRCLNCHAAHNILKSVRLVYANSTEASNVKHDFYLLPFDIKNSYRESRKQVTFKQSSNKKGALKSSEIVDAECTLCPAQNKASKSISVNILKKNSPANRSEIASAYGRGSYGRTSTLTSILAQDILTKDEIKANEQLIAKNLKEDVFKEHTGAKMLIGIEQEIEWAAGTTNINLACLMEGLHDVFCKYFGHKNYSIKSDGSLNAAGSIELVYPPARLEYMESFAFAKNDLLLDLFWQDIRDFTALPSNSNAGTHIHIDKRSFESSRHFNRFRAFILNNKKFIFNISGRRSTEHLNSWASLHKDSPEDVMDSNVYKDWRASSDRYKACNCTTYGTVELRFFGPIIDRTALQVFLTFIKLLFDYTSSKHIFTYLSDETKESLKKKDTHKKEMVNKFLVMNKLAEVSIGDTLTGKTDVTDFAAFVLKHYLETSDQARKDACGTILKAIFNKIQNYCEPLLTSEH